MGAGSERVESGTCFPTAAVHGVALVCLMSCGDRGFLLERGDSSGGGGV